MGDSGRSPVHSFRPPARLVVVHGSLLFGTDSINALCESLSKVTALALSLSGVCRIPFLGLSATCMAYPAVFPLQHLRVGSFSKLQESLDLVKSSLLHTMSDSDHAATRELFQAVLTEALNQHHEQSATLHQLVGYLPQLEVSVITPLQPKPAVTMLSQAAQNVDLQMIKKLQLICITSDSNDPETAGQAESPFNESQGKESDSSNSSCAEIIDVVSITPDVLQFENIFKQWLQDDSTEKEHVHIHMPAESQSSRPYTLKCDILERILPPAQLPGASEFTLHTATSGAPARPTGRHTSGHSGLNLSKSSSSTSHAQLHGDARWPHHLKSIALVKTSGVCDSVIFGSPLFLRPTACWKLDWEELDCNQRRFHALLQLLSEQGDALILAQEVALPVASGGVKPMAHFIAMACPNSSALLLRPVAIGDILLPAADVSQTLPSVPTEDSELVKNSLQKLEVLETYNPLLMPGFMMKSLVAGLLKESSMQANKTATAAGKKRRGIQRPASAGTTSKKVDRGFGQFDSAASKYQSAFKSPGMAPGTSSSKYRS
eukprot:scpid64058/ scgid2308/ Uncharacterized protein C2orf65